MSFDEQLRRAFDTLSDHLRDELARQVASLVDELSATAAAEREHAAADARAELDEALAAADTQRQQAIAAANQERDAAVHAAVRERDQAVADAARRHDDAMAAAAQDRDRLDAAVRDRDQALADAARVHEDTLAAARREREEALAAAQRDHDESIESARAEAAAAAFEQARADAERDAASRLASAAADAEARGRQDAEAALHARVERLQAELRDAEARAHAAQQDSRDALERAVSVAHADARSDDATAFERLLDGVRAIDRARSLSHILDTLVSCAGREAARAGILLARGTELRGWRFVGFNGQIDFDAVVAYADAGIVADAVRSGKSVAAGTGESSPPRFAALADRAPAVAVPLAIGSDVVAVLYADQANDGQAVVSRWTDAIEVLARHAASTLEALTAFKAARALVAPRHTGHADAADPSDGREAARRYARLLVSEIKLYHEADVLAGRRDRDLATRLSSEIEHARGLFNERVPASVRAGHDFFQAELVETLASGDPSLLGQARA